MSSITSLSERIRRSLAAMAVAVAACVAAVPAVAAVTYEVDSNGILTGARNVNVGGNLYDVRFVVSDCISLYTGCNSNSDFPFDEAGATLAANALMQQVFVDTPTALFDSNPLLTQGCTSAPQCLYLTPFGFGNNEPLDDTGALFSSRVGAIAFSNTPVEIDDGVFSVREFPWISLAAAVPGLGAYATWDRVLSPIPEPSAFAMGVMGLACLAALRRRRVNSAPLLLP